MHLGGGWIGAYSDTAVLQRWHIRGILVMAQVLVA
jgi:hypothetical protein